MVSSIVYQPLSSSLEDGHEVGEGSSHEVGEGSSHEVGEVVLT